MRKTKLFIAGALAALGLTFTSAGVEDPPDVDAASCTINWATYVWPDQIIVRCSGNGGVSANWRCKAPNGSVTSRSAWFYNSGRGTTTRYFSCPTTHPALVSAWLG